MPGEVAFLLALEEKAEAHRWGVSKWGGIFLHLPVGRGRWRLQQLDRKFSEASRRGSGCFQMHREPLGRFKHGVRGSGSLIYWLLKTTLDIRKI